MSINLFPDLAAMLGLVRGFKPPRHDAYIYVLTTGYSVKDNLDYAVFAYMICSGQASETQRLPSNLRNQSPSLLSSPPV